MTVVSQHFGDLVLGVDRGGLVAALWTALNSGLVIGMLVAREASGRIGREELLGAVATFTESVVAKDNRKLYRARFAGLERDQAETVCKTLKRADISCITVRN